MPTEAQQNAYNELLASFRLGGFGMNPDTPITMSEERIPDYYGYVILPDGEIVDQRSPSTGGGWLNDIMQAAGQALPYVGAAMAGLGVAQGAGLVGNLGAGAGASASTAGMTDAEFAAALAAGGTEDISPAMLSGFPDLLAGSGAGEVATYGLGGSGLSGTGALTDSGASILDTWTPGSVGGISSMDAGAAAALPGGEALGTISGAGAPAGLLGTWQPGTVGGVDALDAGAAAGTAAGVDAGLGTIAGAGAAGLGAAALGGGTTWLDWLTGLGKSIITGAAKGVVGGSGSGSGNGSGSGSSGSGGSGSSGVSTLANQYGQSDPISGIKGPYEELIAGLRLKSAKNLFPANSSLGRRNNE